MTFPSGRSNTSRGGARRRDTASSARDEVRARAPRAQTDAKHAPASRDEQLEAARAVALRMLTGAPRTRRQIADGLRRRGYADDVVEELVERLTDVGLLDDAELAGMIARSQLAERSLSRRGIAAELRRRGIEDDDARAAVETIDDDAEDAALRELVRKRLARTAGLERDVRVRRVMGVLARKGYAPGPALAAISAELGAERDELASRDDVDAWSD
ncbi:regulatory protein RecX [Luteimicrobium sp. NPDC057192]|uniref:regulatory protein RecX n=1 Tax=Luteimicrobium sp. NPDC057192 TaxID=3346042 RepID=UPI003630CA50